MKATNDEFIQQGISRYLEACATVQHFQVLLEELLVGVLEGRHDWGRFVLRGTQAVKAQSSRVRSADQWIEAQAIGKLDKTDVTIELGFWWGQDAAPAPAVVFGGFCVGPKEIQSFRYTRSKHDGYTAFRPASRTYIGKAITASSNLTLEAEDLLDELLSATGIMK